MMLKLVLFFAVLSTVFCVKLSEEFDAERAEMCGLSLTPEKPSSNPPDDKVPWTLAINYQQRDQKGKMQIYYGSAILVSARHVIAPAYMAVGTVPNTTKKQWEWADETRVDFKQCQENEMEIPLKTLKTIKVSISICQDPQQCGTDIVRSVITGWYLGNCQSGEIPFGLLLLEFSSNVPQDAPFFVPVCIPAEKKPAFLKDTVHFDSIKVKGKFFIVSDSATIQSCSSEVSKFVQSICAKRSVCEKGRAGTLVKKIDGRETGIAVLYEWNDKCKNEHYVSIGFFKDKLCSLAGVCKETTPPAEETSSQSSVHRILVFLILGLFLLFQ